MEKRGKEHKKHPCADCVHCQWCGDDRCGICRGRKCARSKKLSVQEQIELYERLNSRGENV